MAKSKITLNAKVVDPKNKRCSIKFAFEDLSVEISGKGNLVTALFEEIGQSHTFKEELAAAIRRGGTTKEDVIKAMRKGGWPEKVIAEFESGDMWPAILTED